MARDCHRTDAEYACVRMVNVADAVTTDTGGADVGVWTMSDPAEKYRDKVSPSHIAAMQAIGMMRMMLGQHREKFEELLESERNMHSIGCMLDPSLYRDMIYSKSFEQQLRLIRAALAFLSVADEIAKELGSS